jgi:hypothetical protein
MFFSKFYKVGMISLLFIPAICIPYLKVEYKKRDFRFLKLNMPAPSYGNGIGYDYSMLDKIRKEAFLKDLDFNDPKLEERIHEFSRLDSNQAFLEQIPVNGYQCGFKIKINSQTTYETFVKLLNICHKYQMQRYAYDLRYDEMYIVDIFYRPQKETPPQLSPIFLGDCIVIEEPEKTVIQVIAEKVNNYILPIAKSFIKTLPVYLGFLALVFVAYRKKI